MFIHQLAREVWWYESRFPLSAVGYYSEPHYLSPYRRTPVVTVSDSTRSDLIRLGFKGAITVIPTGLEPLTPVQPSRTIEPAFIYVGRMTPSKRVLDIIRAFGIFSASVGRAQLTLLGDGPPSYVKKLKALAAELGISDRIRFMGRQATEAKHQEMADAHILLLASVREGWGLVVSEANGYGTPAIAYDVAGLRDSIRPDVTGVLVDQSHDGLADGMLRIWRDPETYRRLSRNAQQWSATFSFDQATDTFRSVLVGAIDRQLDRHQAGPMSAPTSDQTRRHDGPTTG
jgi:glycosyltransferase involved in cell wall biosynthesis